MSPPPQAPTEKWTPPGAVAKEKKKAPPLKAPVKKVKSKKSFLFVWATLLLILIFSGWIYMEWTSFNKAKEKWSTVHTLLEKGEYEQVSQQCAEIIELLGRVHIVMAAGKKELLAQVQDIAGSEHFQEAMGGKVYFKNKYVSKMAHQAYVDIEKLIAAGEKEGSVSNWQGALVSYEAALDVAEKNKKRLDEEFYAKVVFMVRQAQFANHVAQGKKAFISKSWPMAIDNFSKAIELAKVKDVADPTSSYDVNRYLQRALFSQYLVDGDKFLKEGSWNEAVANYQGAYDIAKKEDVIDTASKESVTLKLHQTTLMKGITEGDKFTTSKKWTQAIAEYEKAEAVLPYDVTIPGKSMKETQNTVAASLLTALLNRDQEESRAYLANKEYVKAITVLKRSIRTIDSSSLKDKAQWQLMKKQAEDDLKRASLQGVIEEKTEYLKEQYTEIFVENFVGVRAQALDQPQIKFLEATGSALVFRVRCRELRDLKYYTLELIYQYDMAKDKWGFQGGE
jgi:tetratricopeptide (TPR) repeat protein